MKIAYAQISPEYLKDFLLKRFDLPNHIEVIYLHQGFNDTYRIKTSSQKFILRVYRHDWKSYDDIAGELELLNLLHQNKIKVSFPIPNQENQLIHALDCPEGRRYFVLFSYASGKALPTLDLESARLFGQHLAQIHTITEHKVFRNLSKDYRVPAIFAATRSALQGRLGMQHTTFGVLEQIEQAFNEKLNPDTLQHLTQGICHGDPHFENCFLDRDGGLTFFDFDFCGNGYLLYDLGSFFRYERNRPEIKESLIEGYNNVKPLNEMDLSLIPYFEILMRLFHLGARAKKADGVKSPLWPVAEIEKTTLDISKQLTTIKL